MIWLLSQTNRVFYGAGALLCFWGILYVFMHYHADRPARALLDWGAALIVLSLQPAVHLLAPRSLPAALFVLWLVQSLGTLFLLAGAAEQRQGRASLKGMFAVWGGLSSVAVASLFVFRAGTADFFPAAVFGLQGAVLIACVAACAWKDKNARHVVTYIPFFVYAAASVYFSLSLLLNGDIALYEPVVTVVAMVMTALLAASTLMEVTLNARNGTVRLETLVEYSTHGMAFIDETGSVEWANHRMLELTGADLRGRSFKGISADDIGLGTLLREHMRTNSSEVVIDFDALAAAGEPVGRRGKARFDVTVRSVPANSTSPGGLFVQVEDITQLRDTMNELSEKRPQLEMMLQAAKAYEFVMEGSTIYARSLLQALGYDRGSVESHEVNEFIHPQDHLPSFQQKDVPDDGDGPSFSREIRVKDSCGNYVWFLISSRFVNIDGKVTLVGMAVNIDDHKRMESFVMQCERLAAVGQLANGVAHDINNQLLTLQTAISLLPTSQDNAQRLRYAQYMQEAVDNCAGTLKRLVSFSKGEDTSFAPVAMDGLLSATVAQLERSLGPGVQLRLRDGAGGARVYGDYYELQNALMNIGLNACDAVRDSGGEIRVRSWVADWNPLKPGGTKWYYVSVADNGGGMSAEVQKRIFDPFFTTKSNGRGNGLGLYTTYGSIQRHQGTITVESGQGEGTVITVALPLYEGDAG